MKLKVDTESDALYLRLDEARIIESEEVQPGVILDYNEAGQSNRRRNARHKRAHPIEELKTLQFETI